MSTELNRRGFLAGIGAAIVAINTPAIIVAATERKFAPFTIPPSDNYFTATYLAETITGLGRQVEALGPLTAAERITVAGMVEDAIDQVRPIGILVKVTAPMDQVAHGKFWIVETSPGTVEIRAA